MYAAAISQPTQSPIPTGAGPILIVEDDELIREVLVAWLQGEGWSTLEAGDARTALKLASEARPAVAICDMHLNGGPDGGWLSAQLHAFDPTLAIIFATGERELPAALTLRPGVIGYLLKPYGRREVLAHLRTAAAMTVARRGQAQTESELEAESVHRRQTLARTIARVKASGEVNLEYAAAALLGRSKGDSPEATARLAGLAEAFGLDFVGSGLSVAARFRNLGRAVVPERVLSEPRDLRPFERKLVRQYPLESAEALDNLGWHDAAVILWSLREQWNGLGYPFSMEGEEIPLAARILAVFDTFEAVTSERPHRRALTRPEAIELLRRHAGAAFDPDVVEAFVARLAPAMGMATCH